MPKDTKVPEGTKTETVEGHTVTVPRTRRPAPGK